MSRCLSTKLIVPDELSAAAATSTDDYSPAACHSDSSRCHCSACSSLPGDANDSAMKHFAWISQSAPQFAIDGRNVHVISEPSDFYETLKVCPFLIS